MPAIKTPYSVYEDRLASGEIRADADQAAAVNLLDDVFRMIVEARPQSFLGRLLKKQTVGRTAGIYMYGGVGRGKSMLMDLFFESLPETVNARRVHFHEFMIEIHDYIHEKRQAFKKSGVQSPDTYITQFVQEHCKDLRVLCFDEFHVTDVADAMLLGKLMSSFIERNIVVICTSNWVPDLLYEDGLQRGRFLPVIALIKARMYVVPLDGETDYRMQSLAGSGVYFYPLGAVADKKADELFRSLTNNEPIGADLFTVKGRDITARQVANNVARFSFSELCEQPLGAEDYLTIAKRYDAIFIQGIPALGYDRRNETKRLMTLIDALYEQGTKLIVTADKPANQLYRGHDYEFEFQRTVSRLIEMQGEKYLEGR